MDDFAARAAALFVQDLLQLREWLDEKLAEHEDKLMLANPRIMAEIREARVEYEAGEQVKLDELQGEKALRPI